MEKGELEKALTHDAARRGISPPSDRPVKAVRKLLLDAVLLVEKADLTLAESSVWILRDDLLKAAHMLKQAANGLVEPDLYLPKDEDKR